MKAHNIAPSPLRAREEDLSAVTNPSAMHVSCLVDNARKHQLLLSPPLGAGGGFSNYRVALDIHPPRFSRRRSLAVKEVYMDADAAEAHHKRPTTRASLAHEQAMQRAAQAEGFLYTLEDDGRVFQVMRRKDGDLFDVVISKARTPEFAAALAMEVIRQIGKHLSRAHRHNIVHNDVKLENVLWCTDGTLSLIDYGAAHDLAHDPPPQELTFTPQYAAPERLAGAESGTPADIWSVGIMLLHILRGASHPLVMHKTPEKPASRQRMCQRTDAFTRWHRIGSSEPNIDKFARQLRLDVGQPLADFILLRLLHPDPAQRATAADLANFVSPLHALTAARRTRQYLRLAAQQKACQAAAQALATLHEVAEHHKISLAKFGGPA